MNKKNAFTRVALLSVLSFQLLTQALFAETPAGESRDPIELIVGDVHSFLDHIFTCVKQYEISVDSYDLDHVGYRTATTSGYLNKKQELSLLGTLLHEAIVCGRACSVFKLHDPIRYENRAISIVELTAPKKGKYKEPGLDHAEFLVSDPLEVFAEQYPAVEFDLSRMDSPDNPDVTLSIRNGTKVRFHAEALDDVVLRQKQDPSNPALVEKAQIYLSSILLQEHTTSAKSHRVELSEPYSPAGWETESGLAVGLSGQVRVEIADEHFLLSMGDTIAVPAGVRRTFTQEGTADSEILYVFFN